MIINTYDEFLNALNNDTVRITAYIGNYECVVSAKGTKYIQGDLHLTHKIPFKIWSGPMYDLFSTCKVEGIFDIDAQVNDYNDTRSLILKNIDTNERLDLDRADYIETPYDGKKLWHDLFTYIQMMSKEAIEVYKTIITSTNTFKDSGNSTSYKDAFITSVAAVSHHDAYISGLIAHTSKVVKNVLSMTEHYPQMQQRINKDVLILGALLHDIGKVVEYEGLGISMIGQYCSHLSIGVEILAEHKSYIIEKLGEEAYYKLQSIISQHHGPYGDRPRTIEAYLIHKADIIESELESLEEEIVKNPTGQITIFTNDAKYKLI